MGGGSGDGTCGVPRVDAREVSAAEFRERFVRRGMPCVLAGLQEGWPAREKWTPAFFRDQHGDLPVAVARGANWGQMRLRDYVDRLGEAAAVRAGGGAEARAGDVAGIVGSDGAEGETPYLRTWNFLDDLPELRRDFNPGAHFADLFKALPESMQPPFEWLFIGPAGSHTRLHVDVWGTDAWLAQLQGLKRFTLFHPAHRKFLERDDGPGGACHWVDLRAPDAELFPDFAQAVAIETVLEPGEVIYLPRKWPHAVDGLTDTVSLTVNFMCPWSKNYVVPLLRKYAERRAMCEKVLGRSLKANDNAMKFCVHGGSIPLEMAKSILGAAGTLGQAGEEEEADDDGVQEGGGGSTTEGGGEGE